MIRATTIFNRAGTSHLWQPLPKWTRNGGKVRSLCSLFDLYKNLDELGSMKQCKRCESAKLALDCRGLEDSVPRGGLRMADLLPCPFCGGLADFERIGTRRHSCIVACTNCGCRHESSDEGRFSGDSWNRREPPSQDSQEEKS